MTIAGDVHYYVVKHDEIGQVLERIKELQAEVEAKKPLSSQGVLDTVKDMFQNVVQATNEKMKSSEKLFGLFDKVGYVFQMGANSPEILSPISLRSIHSSSPTEKLERQPSDKKIISIRRSSMDDAFALSHPDKHAPFMTITDKKVRSISFRNQHRNNSVNIDDWILDLANKGGMKKSRLGMERKQSDEALSSATTSEAPESPTSISSPKKRRQRILEEDSNEARSSTPSPIRISIASTPNKQTQDSTIFFQARYYGTEDDFLMKAAFRSYFKQNALNQDDAKLFHLYPNGHQNANVNPADLVGAENAQFRHEMGRFLTTKIGRLFLLSYIALSSFITLFAGMS